MQVKVLTLNIWEGKVLDNAIDFLKKEDADFILLQEVYNSENENLEKRFRLFSELKKALPSYENVFGLAFTDTTNNLDVDSGNAIFSKYKIITSDVTFFDEPYRRFNQQEQTDFSRDPQTILHAVVDVQGNKFNVFSVHGVWGKDGNDTERRLNMGDVIAQSIKDRPNVILGGDFNLSANTQTVKKIEEYVTSVFGTTLTTTFNMKYKKNPGYATAAVDMVFLSSNFKVVSKECLEIDVSDHLPLRVVFEV